MATQREPDDLRRVAAQSGWVRRLAVELARDVHAGEDIAQDALLAAARSQQQPGSLRAWLVGAVRNLAKFRRRAEGRRVAREQLSARPECCDDPLIALERLELQEALLGAVRELSEPYRTTLLLRWFEELEPEEIAQRTRTPVRTVHTRLHRALALLRETLERRSKGDRSRWLAAWLPALSNSSTGWKWLLLMELKTKLALAGLAALAVTTVWIVSDPAPQPEAPAKLALAGEPGRDVATDSSAPFEVTKALAEHRETAFELGSQSPAPTDADGRRRISGIVIDVTGKRLPGVDLVFQSGEPARTDPAIRGSSDSSGGFELAADSGHGGRIDPVSSDWVVVYKPELRVPDPIDGYVLVLARPRRIHGIVRDNPGTQINGAEVWLSYMVPNPDLGIALWGTRPPKPSSRRDSPGFGFFGDPLRRSIGVDLGITELQDQGWNTRSSSSGSFLIQGVDSLPNARICASAPSYDDGEAELQEHVDEVVVVLHKRSDVRSGEIYGRVVDPNGSAVSQACLRFGAHQAVSDEQGEFVIGIGEQGPGTRLIAFHQDWRPVLQPCLSKSPSDRDAWPDPLILQFTRPQTGIAGVVVDLAGRPVPGVEVLTLDPLSWNQMFGTLGEPPVRGGDGSERVLGDESVTTDSNGQFSVAASAERRTRLLVRDRQSLEIAVSEPVPASTKGASIVLGDAGGRCRLAGRLMDLRGTPIVDAAISATRTVHGSGPRAEVRLETGQVRTDAAGQFELRDMSRDIEGFIIWPDRTTPTNVVPIDPLTPRDQLIVRVGRMARVQIELHTAGLAADSAAFLDGSGAVLPVGATIGKHGWSGGDRRGIGDGKSEVMIVSEEATTLVLRLLGQEVARVPIALDPATVTLVRP